MPERTLRELALEMRTDKEGTHFYADAYERHLGHLRAMPITLLEIGVGGYADPSSGGESLRMWKAFFPRARIIGVDIHDKAALAEDRIEIVRGDQSDPDFLASLASSFGPFDVVIDDGSHICAHAITTFRHLFGHLTDEGIYAIEDLQTSYWRSGYGGSSGPDRTGTTMTFLKELVDGLNYAELDIAGYEPSEFDLSITSMTFYHNLAFIQRGPNRDPSNVLPPHPRDRTYYVPKPGKPPRSRSRARLRGAARRLVPARLRPTIKRSAARLRSARPRGRDAG